MSSFSSQIVIPISSSYEIDRKIFRFIDKQIDRQIDSLIDRYLDKQINRYLDRQIDIQIDRYLDRKIDIRYTELKIDFIIQLTNVPIVCIVISEAKVSFKYLPILLFYLSVGESRKSKVSDITFKHLNTSKNIQGIQLNQIKRLSYLTFFFLKFQFLSNLDLDLLIILNVHKPGFRIRHNLTDKSRYFRFKLLKRIFINNASNISIPYLQRESYQNWTKEQRKYFS